MTHKPVACGLLLVGLLVSTAAAAERGTSASRTAMLLPLLPPLAASPQPWPSSMLMAEPGRWYLPAAVLGREPRRAETAHQQPLRLRPTLDRPLLAGPAGPAMAAPYLVPSGPRAYTPAADVTQLTPGWRAAAADAARPETTTDAAGEAARRRMLAAEPPLRQKAAPFLRLAIPNPLEPIAELRLTKPRPDADAPTPRYDPPPKPVWPVLEQKP